VAARTADEVLETATDVVPTAAVRLEAVVPALLIAVLLVKTAAVVVPVEAVVVVELLRVMTQDVVTLFASI
jgi:hypothetical protein